MDLIVLELDGIDGEYTVEGFEKKIKVMSYSWGVSQPMVGDAANQKRTAGRPNHQDFMFTKVMDLASCKLIDYCNNSTVIKTGKMSVIHESEKKMVAYMVYEFTELLVSSYSVGAGGDVPTESVTLNYAKITQTYTVQGVDVANPGKDSCVWDLTKNSAT
jgi:type VI secretion system secreted protein Hcp